MGNKETKNEGEEAPSSEDEEVINPRFWDHIPKFWDNLEGDTEEVGKEDEENEKNGVDGCQQCKGKFEDKKRYTWYGGVELCESCFEKMKESSQRQKERLREHLALAREGKLIFDETEEEAIRSQEKEAKKRKKGEEAATLISSTTYNESQDVNDLSTEIFDDPLSVVNNSSRAPSLAIDREVTV
eukprot:TRINITY_DN9554_c0_g1_i1.p1 TRINITY_DN9554_c0_g1~~TRINITY_DN9554_c0_g1_i1.p1  ORF type:complete len:185 (+),score=60.60 TRINITY_DN9554_c0_g1_i1:55-609(+)